MTSATATCLTCFADIPESALSKCVIHSCCSRAICTTCLSNRPRLSTFCPFCEGVQHAFRKGPRADVIRAGQTIFDIDNTNLDGLAGDVTAPPPAYQDSRFEKGAASMNFVIDDKDEDDIEDKKPRTPQLLQRSRSGEKQGPMMSPIDRKSAMTEISTSESHPSTDILRNTLSKIDKDSTPTLLHDRARTSKSPSGSIRSRRQIRVEDKREEEGLTRQYWLRPNDTLFSLCLRFKVNAAIVCKLNDLPLSTATSTPHLIHTRQFLLIPEGAIQSALSNGDAEALQSALDGPVAQSKRQKIQRARKEAESRFRVLITKSESMKKGKDRAASDGSDITLCDARAARAYIALMEDEFRHVDFGDGEQKFGALEDPTDDTVEELDGSVEAGRRERYDVIVKQAIARWEMDSDWERIQRANGFSPDEIVAPRIETSRRCNNASLKSENGWLRGLLNPSTLQSPTMAWPEKSR